MLGRSVEGKEGVKLWLQGRGEEKGVMISLLVTHSSMQTVSPQGRNQERGPLTLAVEEGGEYPA